MYAWSGDRATVDRLIAEKGLSAAGAEVGVAAILYTYHCTIACAHCCFGCSPEPSRARMETGRVVENLRSLHELGRVIHIAGGEAMAFWDDLADVVDRSYGEGVQPHFIETNCSFATGDAIVRERFELLKSRGVVGILFSADPFHQAHVPPERVLRARRLAREIFGPRNVWGSDAPDEAIVEGVEIARDDERLREYARKHPPMLVGSAQERLARFFDARPVDEIPLDCGWMIRYKAADCLVDFAKETIWEIHVDPYDNIQTNCGVLLGNTRERRLRDVMAAGPESANFITEILARSGPRGLAEFARDEHDFEIPERACTKCDLCYVTRKFLRSHYPDVLGPPEIYGGSKSALDAYAQIRARALGLNG